MCETRTSRCSWFRKSRGTRNQIASIHWITEKSREFQKNIYFSSDCAIKSLTMWTTTNSGKFSERWEYQTLLVFWETCMQVKKQQLEPDMEEQIGSKLGKDYKAVYCHPAYAEYILWNAGLDESQAGIKIARRNINSLRYADDTTLKAESKEELKSLEMRVKEGSEKAGLNSTLKELRSWHLWSHHFMANRW